MSDKNPTAGRGITAVLLFALVGAILPVPFAAWADTDEPFGCTVRADGDDAILDFSGAIEGNHAHLRDQDGWVSEVTDLDTYRDSGGAGSAYHVVMRNPQVITERCIAERVDFTCSVLTLGDDAVLHFWGEGVGATAAVFQNGDWQGRHTGQTQYVAPGGAGDAFRVWLDDSRQSVECDGSVTEDYSCAAFDQDGDAHLSFSGSEAETTSANVRDSNGWLGSVTGSRSYLVAGGADETYVVKLHALRTAVACDHTTPPSNSGPYGQSGDWVLDFEDDFDGDALNLELWEPVWYDNGSFQRSVNDRENACYHADQVEVSGGLLRLSLSAEDDPACQIKDGSASEFVGAQITTRADRSNDRYETTSGYFEARMFLPSTDGDLHNWPAFWVNGYDWPSQGEIDIMEGLRERQPCASFHWEDDSGRHQHEKTCADYAEAGGWHIFAAEWGQGEVTFYYDGVELGSAPEGTVTNEPHFMALQYTTNHEWGSPVLDTMLVDYVRVWQRAG